MMKGMTECMSGLPHRTGILVLEEHALLVIHSGFIVYLSCKYYHLPHLDGSSNPRRGYISSFWTVTSATM